MVISQNLIETFNRGFVYDYNFLRGDYLKNIVPIKKSIKCDYKIFCISEYLFWSLGASIGIIFLFFVLSSISAHIIKGILLFLFYFLYIFYIILFILFFIYFYFIFIYFFIYFYYFILFLLFFWSKETNSRIFNFLIFVQNNLRNVNRNVVFVNSMAHIFNCFVFLIFLVGIILAISEILNDVDMSVMICAYFWYLELHFMLL